MAFLSQWTIAALAEFFELCNLAGVGIDYVHKECLVVLFFLIDCQAGRKVENAVGTSIMTMFGGSVWFCRFRFFDWFLDVFFLAGGGAGGRMFGLFVFPLDFLGLLLV